MVVGGICLLFCYILVFTTFPPKLAAGFSSFFIWTISSISPYLSILHLRNVKSFPEMIFHFYFAVKIPGSSFWEGRKKLNTHIPIYYIVERLEKTRNETIGHKSIRCLWSQRKGKEQTNTLQPASWILIRGSDWAKYSTRPAEVLYGILWIQS